ncbi:MAG: hypothetical protein C0498_03560 [Anaerolinea sp.]|nr:hypothetical protein [Anaerolinea sp.]
MEASAVRFGVLDGTLVSDAILPLLDRGGRGEVHSVFASALNLEVGGHLITITARSLDPLPNGIRVGPDMDFRGAGLRPGLRVQVGAWRIVIPGARMWIDLDGATPWSPQIARAKRGIAGDTALERWLARAAGVRALAATRVGLRSDGRAGLGPLLSPAASIPLPSVAALAAPRLARLSAALRDGGEAAASAAAEQLVGLGPGLTPSGDDALVGVAAALAATAGPDTAATAFLRRAADGAAARTTAVAAMFLWHAAAGQFAGRLHALLAALLDPDLELLVPAIDRAIGWGATSGTDTLVGVLAGLDAVAGLVAGAVPTDAVPTDAVPTGYRAKSAA